MQDESVTGKNNPGEIMEKSASKSEFETEEESTNPLDSETEVLENEGEKPRIQDAAELADGDSDTIKDHAGQDNQSTGSDEEEPYSANDEKTVKSVSSSIPGSDLGSAGTVEEEVNHSVSDPPGEVPTETGDDIEMKDSDLSGSATGKLPAGVETAEEEDPDHPVIEPAGGTIVEETKPATEKKQEEFKVDYSTLTREDLVTRLDELLESKSVQDIRTDVDNIKLNYYKKFKIEVEQKRKKFVEEGGDIDDFQAPEDHLESQIKELFKKFRELKANSNRLLEQEKVTNLEKKYEVIEKIKDLINRKESINKTFQEFRDLQKEWRSIGLVPQQNLKDLWDTYNHHVEKFYDYIKINKELRDLDLKKNLEAKIELCEKAEELLLEPFIISAFNKLQKFHDEWREIGPVPAEMRAEIWERFRDATSKINRKHQQHFENLKKEQKKNLEQKRILCEKAEEISNLVLSSIKEWEEKSKELIDIQKVWRSIGFAPKKDNNKIYKRFRSACDQFFNRKREFYAQNKEMYQNNLQLKTDLCIQAEALKDSTEWKKTSEDLIHLQERWKEIGPVPRKYSDHVWKRFRAACDHFFERKSAYYSSIDKTFEDNLLKKEQLIEEIESCKLTNDLAENFKILNDFQRRWADIGFVPLKEKDAIQERYRLALNQHYDNLKIDDHKKNLLKFRNRINNILQKPKSDLKLRQERDKFVARLQQLKSDIVLWENNIGFFAKSKNAQAMIDEVNNKISNARDTIKLLEAKIELIDNLEIDQG
ncbi:MAG: hypothetical protein AMS27_04185 [Bacteroides sp. SM23_62_1]|nr:MAG: hypothetical protein AMS27_04185 [Bacteroides sp. SM23_62_1]